MSRYYRTTRARETGTKVTTGHADDVGLDRGFSDYDGIEHTLWYNVCEEHFSIVGHQTLALAKAFASCPTQWCEECRDGTFAEPRPGYLCTHEAGHIVATWLAGVPVVMAGVTDTGNYSGPDWHGERVVPRWPERDRYERVRVFVAGKAAWCLFHPDLGDIGEPVAADDRREFEFHHDDWDVAVAEMVEDLAPYRLDITVVAEALREHGTLDAAALEALRFDLGLA